MALLIGPSNLGRLPSRLADLPLDLSREVAGGPHPQRPQAQEGFGQGGCHGTSVLHRRRPCALRWGFRQHCGAPRGLMWGAASRSGTATLPSAGFACLEVVELAHARGSGQEPQLAGSARGATSPGRASARAARVASWTAAAHATYQQRATRNSDWALPAARCARLCSQGPGLMKEARVQIGGNIEPRCSGGTHGACAAT